jgi:hypothetical protein
MFFSHDKLANSIFSYDFSDQRWTLYVKYKRKYYSVKIQKDFGSKHTLKVLFRCLQNFKSLQLITSNL